MYYFFIFIFRNKHNAFQKWVLGKYLMKMVDIRINEGNKKTLGERYREDLVCSMLNLKKFQEGGFGQQCPRLDRSKKKKKKKDQGWENRTELNEEAIVMIYS